MNTKESMTQAAKVWRENISPIREMRKQAKIEAAAAGAEIEARLEAEIAVRKEAAARAIHYSLEHGASKSALRRITTSDHYGFEGYVDLGAELAERDRTDQGDHDLFAHYCRKTDIERWTFEGGEITALCGKKWRPSRDFAKHPVCPECKEVYETARDE